MQRVLCAAGIHCVNAVCSLVGPCRAGCRRPTLGTVALCSLGGGVASVPAAPRPVRRQLAAAACVLQAAAARLVRACLPVKLRSLLISRLPPFLCAVQPPAGWGSCRSSIARHSRSTALGTRTSWVSCVASLWTSAAARCQPAGVQRSMRWAPPPCSGLSSPLQRSLQATFSPARIGQAAYPRRTFVPPKAGKPIPPCTHALCRPL